MNKMTDNTNRRPDRTYNVSDVNSPTDEGVTIVYSAPVITKHESSLLLVTANFSPPPAEECLRGR